MLGTPEKGWVSFQLDEVQSQLSYLSDIPNQWLDRAIFGLESGLEFQVEGHCEPETFQCTVASQSCSYGLSGESLWEISMGMEQFCRELYRDISQNLDAWARWESLRWDLTEKERIYAARKQTIAAKLKRLKELLKNKASCRE